MKRFMSTSLITCFLSVVGSGQPVFNCKLAVELYANKNGVPNGIADGLVVVFDSAFSAAVGPEDSHKFINQDENMAIDRDHILLSNEGRPQISQADTIPIRIWQYRRTNYFIKIKANCLPAGTFACINDKFLNTSVPINIADRNLLAY